MCKINWLRIYVSCNSQGSQWTQFSNTDYFIMRKMRPIVSKWWPSITHLVLRASILAQVVLLFHFCAYDNITLVAGIYCNQTTPKKFFHYILNIRAHITVVKNLPANAGDERHMGWIHGSGRYPGEEMVIHSTVFAWKISWTEEPCGLKSKGLQRVGHRLSADTHINSHTKIYFTDKALMNF